MQQPTVGHGRDVLYRVEAVERAARVRDVSYDLRFELADGEESYTGSAVVEFGLESPDAPLFLDFTGQPLQLLVNGAAVAIEHHEHRIRLPASRLARRNRVEIGYRNRFDTHGPWPAPLRRPGGRRDLPVLELRAFLGAPPLPLLRPAGHQGRLRLTVTAPESWQVVSAEPADQVQSAGGRRRHAFPPTPPFSSYVFALIAGPYERIGGRHGDVELGLFGRRSMRAELERSVEELLEVTAQGLEYFVDLFGRAYPFGKYDQLFVPEFNAGAMENVGAVTLHDRLLFRDPPTYAQRLVRGEVVLHELAHMWFGDLVTMRWWDDLWLNETFATYLSYRCLADATRFRDAWLSLQRRHAPGRPPPGPAEHDPPRRHDGGGHRRGGRQLRRHHLREGRRGHQAARGDHRRGGLPGGLHTYIERHAWGNATLADFLDALGEAAARPLDEWAQALAAVAVAEHDRAWTGPLPTGASRTWSSARTAPRDHPTLRPHSAVVGLVRRADGEDDLAVEAIPVHIDSGRQRVPEAVGRPAPLFVYPDLGDHDYALVHLDPVSLAFALERLPDLPDPLLRQQVWSSLWEMVRDALLASTDYLAAVRRFAPARPTRRSCSPSSSGPRRRVRRYVPDDRADAEASLLAAPPSTSAAR